ncbi:hypothetical protein [Desulfobulbus sp.]|uniref:hypothetical protein n=1 Tax=Desulfobulbus sp. TaxID=895 RepID=UPI00286F8E83|nr:hypothetical protein [Desulfobulbus sp.]
MNIPPSSFLDVNTETKRLNREGWFDVRRSVQTALMDENEASVFKLRKIIGSVNEKSREGWTKKIYRPTL